MEAQQIFETVATHLFKQGKPAREKGYCKYRAADGSMCAFGALIPDDKYHPDMEGHSSEGVINLYKLEEFKKHIDLIQNLQHLHDNESIYDLSSQKRIGDVFTYEANMREALKFIANHYGLNAEIVDTLHFERK